MSLDLIILSKNYEKFNTLYRDRGVQTSTLLTRSDKSSGGLTRGRGLSKVTWLLSMQRLKMQ